MSQPTPQLDIGRVLTDTIVHLGPLMDAEPDACLQAVVDHARYLVSAAFAGLIILDKEEPGSYRYFKVSGWDRTPHTFPRGHGVFTLPAKTGKPLRIGAVRDHPLSVGTPTDHPPVHAFLGVPLIHADRIMGCMFFGKPLEGGEFSQHDEDIMVAFSTIGAMMIHLVDRKDDERLEAIYEERRRIANELHDTLSQTLFALRKEIREMTNQMSTPLSTSTLSKLAKVEELTQLCQSELRAGLFNLTDESMHPNLTSLSQVVSEFEGISGISTQLITDGNFGKLSLPLRRLINKVVAESLANVYRHAQSQVAVVHVSIDEDTAAVAVQDAGVGISDASLRLIAHPTGHFGLHSIARSVADMKGTLNVFKNEDGGTTVKCTFPLRRPIP